MTNIYTCIYGLFDPRSFDVVMYVGKGGAKRAQRHWKRFLAKGTATNALLCRWFEKLQQEGVTPSWRFLEENVIDWQARERDIISTWRIMNSELCNVADGGNQWSLESGRLGGRRVHECHPGLAAELGYRTHELHPDQAAETFRRMHKLHPELAAKAGRIGGPIGGRRTHELHPEQGAKWSRRVHELHPGHATRAGRIGGRRAHELHPELAAEIFRRVRKLHPGHAAKAGRIGARMGNHNRWHVKRKKFSSKCSLCVKT